MLVDKLPQNIKEIKVTSIKDLIRVLPDNLDYKINVWLGDKIAKYGLDTGNVIFLAEIDEEPSVGMREYFNNLVLPLEINATIRGDWKNRRYSAMRIYNEGRLIIDKKTLCYTELSSPVYEAPILTIEQLLKKLPKEIPFKYTLHLTGGLVKNGFTCNDVDFLAFDIEDKEELSKISQYFTEVLGIKTDVGNKVMKERDPDWYEIYKQGICQQ